MARLADDTKRPSGDPGESLLDSACRVRTEPLRLRSRILRVGGLSPAPPLSPRADDTESQAGSTGFRIKNVVSDVLHWLATNTASAIAFVKQNPEIFMVVLGASTVLFYLAVTGRFNLIKTIKHLAEDDTK